jgi:hypothetical protein
MSINGVGVAKLVVSGIVREGNAACAANKVKYSALKDMVKNTRNYCGEFSYAQISDVEACTDRLEAVLKRQGSRVEGKKLNMINLLRQDVQQKASDEAADKLRRRPEIYGINLAGNFKVLKIMRPKLQLLAGQNVARANISAEKLGLMEAILLSESDILDFKSNARGVVLRTDLQRKFDGLMQWLYGQPHTKPIFDEALTILDGQLRQRFSSQNA